MLDVQTTEAFDEWLVGLDKPVRGRIAARLVKLRHGLWGDHKSVGGNIVELREHFGAGYRVYVTKRGSRVVVVLAGGDKASQTADIARAIVMAGQV